MAGWASPLHLLSEELVQLRDEGVVVPPSLRQRIAELHHQRDDYNYAAVDPLYDAVMALPIDTALDAAEPNDLDAIRALRPAGPRDLGWRPSDADLLDRLHGAWTGRCAGCALGKPVEGMGMTGQDGRLIGRASIKRYLQNRGDWPLKDYFSGRDAGDGLKIWCPQSQRERIAFMEADDDIHYTIAGLGVLEKAGPTFTWEDVAHWWVEHIPYSMVCTAEKQALLNYLTRTGIGWRTSATPAFTRRHRNPYREWIGAQIRSDGWAWACAGKPELAAEFAWRDASWTHERNGIYGEMFFAAIQAAAFVDSDPRRLVEIGLSEIPRDCRLAKLVRDVLRWVAECPDWESCMDRIEVACTKLSPWHTYAHASTIGMSPVHTLNNAAICVLSLFYGRMDTVQTTMISVMCGLDTDCNAATVGSIVGAAAGRARFDAGFAAPLNDTIKPSLIGFQQVTMAELASRTAAVWRTVDGYHGSRGGAAHGAAQIAGAVGG